MSGLTTCLRESVRWLIDLIYPRGVRCLACGGLSRGQLLCSVCAADMETLRLTAPLCPVCGYPLAENGRCDFCRVHGPLDARSAWQHDGAPAKLVRQLKFNALTDALPLLADGIADAAHQLPLEGVTCVTWVPMPRRRMLQRGVDHGRLLAEAVGLRLHLPVRPLLQRSSKKQATQRGSTHAERLLNARRAFECDFAAGTVLLVDDVLTTGSTAQSCIDCLEQAGAERVLVVTATRAIRQTHNIKRANAAIHTTQGGPHVPRQADPPAGV